MIVDRMCYHHTQTHHHDKSVTLYDIGHTLYHQYDYHNPIQLKKSRIIVNTIIQICTVGIDGLHGQ